MLGRRSAVKLFGGGILLLSSGCFEEQPDHRRGLTLQLYVIDQPPAGAQVVELEDETTEKSLLYSLSDLLVKEEQEIPQRYSQQEDISISRGTTNQYISDGPYLFYKSTRFRSKQEATHETLKELPKHDPESGSPGNTLYLQYQGNRIRLQYRVLYSTPT